MLFECERDLVARLDVGGKKREAGEAEAAQGAVEVRGAHGHEFPKALACDVGRRGRGGSAAAAVQRTVSDAKRSFVSYRRASYAPAGSSPLWQPGHQNAVRFASPWPRERIGSPQRGHG